MNKEDIIRMAQECQLIGMRPHIDGIYQESLELFAALVAAAEREACAKVAWEYGWRRVDNGDVQSAAVEIHDAIRARGQA